MSEDGMSVQGHGYRIDVSSEGVKIDRVGAVEDCCLFVPTAEIAGLGEVVDKAYQVGREQGWWS